MSVETPDEQLPDVSGLLCLSDSDEPPISAAEAREAQRRVLEWYAAAGRDLPWRRTRDPYAILVSEIMLQQTGVERVLPKYDEFLERFPSIQDLAAAPTGAVIRIWAGLGYNMRAVRLQGIARQVVTSYGGVIPSTVAELLTLSGVGRYTAGAVACFAYGRDVAFLDTNIRRVLGRVFRGPEEVVPPWTERSALKLAEAVLPAGHAYEWHQALMDIGATVCTVRAPTCLLCPIAALCRSRFRVGYTAVATPARTLRETGPTWDVVTAPDGASAAGDPAALPPRKPRKSAQDAPFVGSTRYYRGRIIAALRAVPPGRSLHLRRLGTEIKAGFTDGDLPWLAELVRRLARDGLLELVDGGQGDPASWQVSLPA